MTRIELLVPDALSMLSPEERERLLRSGLRMAVRLRAQELADEGREAGVHVARYEEKYGVTLDEFERGRLTQLGDVQVHEDYNDWFFWTRVRERATERLKQLEQVEAAE